MPCTLLFLQTGSTHICAHRAWVRIENFEKPILKQQIIKNSRTIPTLNVMSIRICARLFFLIFCPLNRDTPANTV